MPADPRHLDWPRSSAVVALAVLAMGVGLGRSRLTPHEAIWAQTGREMLASGEARIPTLDGRPWLEKPPLGTWLIALSGWSFGGVSEISSRLPSVAAGILISLGVASIASRGFGPRVGLIAGLVQATTPWLILRSRLAESDVILAALVVLAMLAIDRVRGGDRRWRWAFFAAVGLTGLVKGIGFGAVLVGASTTALLVWDRDARTLRALASPLGLALALGIALAWPLAVLETHPQALSLWAVHVTDRLSANPTQFAGEGWLEYLGTPLLLTLPWTPFAILGARRSAGRAFRERGGPDRLLWAWAVVPSALVTMASVRNGHYLIHAFPPMSIWAALSLNRAGERLAERRGWDAKRLRRGGTAIFASLGVGWAVALHAFGPRLNSRSEEFAFYERAGRRVPAGEPLVLLYDLERPDPWDKAPYPTPFGPSPADLAARLFYLDRPATWRLGLDDLKAHPPPPSSSIAMILRERDERDLRASGQVVVLDRGPTSRWDRAFRLVRFTPDPGPKPGR